MREIEFRAKKQNGGEWAYGFIDHTYDDYTIHIHNEHYCYRIIPETIGQYTGLKDKNGTKIFEGDIVKICCGHPDETTLNEVIFEKGKWIVAATGGDLDSLYNQVVECEHEIEVIGNIYDNPELLKESDNA